MKMKKLALLFALVAMACSVQAVSFEWNVFPRNADEYPGMFEKVLETGDFVLVYLGRDADCLNWEGAQVLQTARFRPGVPGKGDVSKNGVSGTFAWRYGEGLWDNGDIFGVMFQDHMGDLYNIISPTGQSQTYTLQGIASDMTPLPVFSVDYYVIPEPTTGALLALGLAVFGLKRKVRA